MALIECPDCQQQVSTEAVACPNCGRPIKAPAQPKFDRDLAAAKGRITRGRWLLYTILVLLGIVAYLNRDTGGPHRARLDTNPRTNACAGWSTASSDQRRKIMLVNISRLDPGRVDARCLERRVDELVRWMTRLCNGGYFPKDSYALAFVDQTDKMCP
jgi:hypothetical protein